MHENEKVEAGIAPEALDKTEVARLLGISKRKVDHLRDLPRVRFSKRLIRYPKGAVLDWLARRTIGA